MAITLVSAPSSTYNAAYEDIEFEFTSDTALIFQLRADLYVGGVYQVTLNAPVELGTSNEFKLDLSEMLQNHVAYNHKTTGISGHALFSANASSVEFYIKVYEVYTVSGVTTTAWVNDQTGIADYTSSTLIVQQHALNPFETQSTYLMTSGSTNPFLTLRPSVSDMLSGEFLQLDLITDVTSIDFNVEEYDSTGSVIATNATAAHATAYKRATAVIDGSVLNAATTKVVVWIDNNTSGFRISDTMTFKIVPVCGTPTIIHWGNYLGGMEQHFFDKRKQQQGRYAHVNMRRGSTELIENVSGNRSVSYAVYSGIESDTFYEFLNEIPANNKNTWWKKSGTFYKIIVSANKCTKKFSDSEDGIDSYKVSYELAKKTPVIRG